MADLQTIIIFVIALCIGNTQLTLAHYCEWGTCEADEYCCAPSKCCTNENKISEVHKIIGWLLAVMTLVLLYLVIKYRSRMCQACIPQSKDQVPIITA